MSDLLHDDITDRLGALLEQAAPSHTAPADLEPLVAEAQSIFAWQRLHAALLERIELHDAPRDRMALTLHATDPDVAAAAAGKMGMEGVFEVLVAAADSFALDIFLSKALLLLDEAGQLYGDLPAVDRLIAIANQIEDAHEDTADQLVSLAQRIEDLRELEETAPVPGEVASDSVRP